MDQDNEWCQPLSSLCEGSLDSHLRWPVGYGHLSMRQVKAVEWYKEVDGLEDNSLMDTNRSGNVYQKYTVDPERLEDWKDTICSEEVQADSFPEKLDWKMRGGWGYM